MESAVFNCIVLLHGWYLEHTNVRSSTTKEIQLYCFGNADTYWRIINIDILQGEKTKKIPINILYCMFSIVCYIVSRKHVAWPISAVLAVERHSFLLRCMRNVMCKRNWTCSKHTYELCRKIYLSGIYKFINYLHKKVLKVALDKFCTVVLLSDYTIKHHENGTWTTNQSVIII